MPISSSTTFRSSSRSLFAQQRTEDEVADHVGGDVEVLVEHARLIHGVLARRVGVERAAERLELEGDLLRRSPLAVPLNTMCSSMCETPIFSRASCSDAARTHAPNATDRTPGIDLREYGQSVRQNGAAESVRRRVTALH